MLRFKRLTDIDSIKEIVKKDNLYKSVLNIDDLEEWIPEPTYGWYAGYEHDELVGFLLLVKESKNSMSFHAGLYKEYRGVGSEYLSKIIAQMHVNLPNYQLWTKTLENNKAAIKCLEQNNFEKTGYIPNVHDNLSYLIYSEKA